MTFTGAICTRSGRRMNSSRNFAPLRLTTCGMSVPPVVFLPGAPSPRH
ncbi:Uncharacterised protein [Mycobacterium tuberculosis]|nr:Uncharacterised protein [Mycobacterium tuberculosis]COW78599.1 Uncharacterised protein [Mycobacterium tuberculosis]